MLAGTSLSMKSDCPKTSAATSFEVSMEGIVGTGGPATTVGADDEKTVLLAVGVDVAAAAPAAIR